LGGEPNVYEQYSPYGRYKDDDSGQRFTQYRLEAQRSAITQATAHSNVPHLSAGHSLSLSRHPNASHNQSYQVIQVVHSGTQPQATEARNDVQSPHTRYGNEVTLFPLDVASWRASVPVKPVLNGPQIAHVVGPKDEEIFCDEHGRVKVQFPWDLEGQYNDQSSCWIRVSQGSAGAGWGAMSIPRVGQEVIVNFLEGDPDQPIIMGRTYDAVNKPPYALPQHKTRMSIKSKTHKGTGFNELRFEDKKGQEEVFIHAEKDFRRFIKNNEVVNIEGKLKVNVIQASEQQAKSVQITANDFIEFTLGGNHIKITPSQIIVSGKNVALKGQAMTTIKGGMVKINAGGGGGSGAKSAIQSMKVEPEVEEFGGFTKQAVDSGKSAKASTASASGSTVSSSPSSTSTSSFPISETYEKPDPKKEAIEKRKENYQYRKKLAANAQNTPEQQAAAKRLLENNDNILRAEAAQYVYRVDEFNRGHIDELPPAPTGLNLLDPKEIEGLEDATFTSKKTGFGAALFESEINDETMLTYRGTNNGVTGWKDWKTNGGQAIGKKTAQYEQAMRLAKLTDRALEGDFVNVGHSLASGLASAASSVTQVKAYTYNGAGLHRNTATRQGGLSNDATANLIQTRAVEGEVLTALQQYGNNIIRKISTAGGAVSGWLTGGVAGGVNGGILAHLENSASPTIPEALGNMKTLPSIKGGSPIARHGMDQVIDGIEAQKKEDINTLTFKKTTTIWDK